MSRHGSVRTVLAGAAILVLAGCTGAPTGTAPDVPGESSGSTSTGVNSRTSSAAPVISARPSGSATSARPSGSATRARPSGSATRARPSGSATSARPSGSATRARPSGSATSQLTGPAATVGAYVTAINGHDYALAWWLGGRNTGLSYPSFVSGFSTTVRDSLTIMSVSGDVVTALLTAQQIDGSIDTYEGTYTVDDGVIIGFHVRQVG
jgi:hypothetical protein